MTEKSPQMYEKKQIIIFKIPNILSKFDLPKFDGAIALLITIGRWSTGLKSRKAIRILLKRLVP
jgi:hypothetical protein